MRRRKVIAIVLGGLGALTALVLAGLLAHPATRGILRAVAEPRAEGVTRVTSDAQLREAFNARMGTVRVVAWLSPT